ncbi:ubiquitin-like modifier-activating enzyme 1 [Xyrauchen texanus]|uniref:ubiquitin-like modifier-activating enzyme 1 n=1 Tax=Xyrauchen texanus TaxID=154827 RepID=UPI002241EE87|nr:ubiquitin-like modifier-activating enzyme 1 [Xyrauchen texanus]
MSTGFLPEVPTVVRSEMKCRMFIESRVCRKLRWHVHQADTAEESDPAFVERTVTCGDVEAVEVLEGVYRSLTQERPQNWMDCVRWARREWEILYNNHLRQLPHCFPPNQVTSSGLRFWMGAKRYPHPLTFDTSNTTHMDFIVAAANLYRNLYGIEGSRNHVGIQNILLGVKMPEFTPKSSVKIAVTDQELKEETDERRVEDNVKQELLQEKLSKLQPSDQNFQMHPQELEKDDGNFHMDYTVAASNLRAENYDIPTANCHNVAGQQFSLWDDYLVHGRREGQEEMTLEELLKHFKAHMLSPADVRDQDEDCEKIPPIR